MSDAGFIILWRKLMGSAIWDLPDADIRLAIVCLLEANWRAGEWFDGRQMVEIERGSFATSINHLSKKCGKRASLKRVRNGLRRLGAAKFLKTGTAKGQNYTMITIVNYSQYQDIGALGQGEAGKDRARGGQGVGKATPKNGQGSGKARATIEQSKQGNHLEQDLFAHLPASGGVERFDFEAIYKLYPRKAGKAKGMEKIPKIVKTQADYDLLSAVVAEMAKRWKGIPTEKCPHWSTFVNGKRWRDESPPYPGRDIAPRSPDQGWEYANDIGEGA